MTETNLDNLAALAPFRVHQQWEDQWFLGNDGTAILLDQALPALNDWAELRKENAELRAYKQRTEAALVKLTAMLEAVFDANPNSPVDDVLHKMDVDLDLYRDPAPKEASDG